MDREGDKVWCYCSGPWLLHFSFLSCHNLLQEYPPPTSSSETSLASFLHHQVLGWILLPITALFKEQICIVSIKDKNYYTCFTWHASSLARQKETNGLNILECCSHTIPMQGRPRVESFGALLPGDVLNSWCETEKGFWQSKLELKQI